MTFLVYPLPKINVRETVKQKAPSKRKGKRRIGQKTVHNLIKLSKTGLSYRTLSEMFGIHHQYVYRICACGLRDDELDRNIR